MQTCNTMSDEGEPLSSKGRKRRRRHASTEIISSEPSSPPIRALRELRGKIVAVSTRTESSVSTTLKRPRESDESYRAMAELCRQAGAVVSPQVHRRVFCVFCTSSAVGESPSGAHTASATQRVRKAWKLRIPVVHVDWLQSASPFPGNFLIEPPLPELQHRIDRAKSERQPTRPSIQETMEGPSITIELGCCCVCHEDLPPLQSTSSTCPWCTDCSVNQGIAKILAEQQPVK
jgi:hypothetical protein